MKAVVSRYELRIIGAVFLACLIGQGTGRAAFGIIAPAMQAKMGYSALFVGSLSSIELLANVIGILSLPVLSSFSGSRNIVVIGGLFQSAGLVMKGIGGHALGFFVAHFLAGLGSAWCFIAAIGLISSHISPARKYLASTVVFSGATGWAAALGILVPQITQWRDWQTCWLVLGYLNVAASFAIYALLPNHLNIHSTGYSGSGIGLVKEARPIAVAYALYGFAFGVFLTFSPTHLVQSFGFDIQLVGRLWMFAWATAAIGSPILGFIFRKHDSVKLVAFQLLGMALAMFTIRSAGTAGIGLSLFTLMVGALVPGVAVLCNRADPEGRYNTFGTVTIFCNLAILISPLVGGLMRDRLSSFDEALTICGLLLVAACAVLIVFRPKAYLPNISTRKTAA